MERKVFSGWQVFAGCFIAMFFMLGGVQTFAVFIPAIMEETKFSLSAVALMSTLATAGSFVGNMLFSRLLKLLGAKKLLFFCSLLCASYFVATSYSTTLLAMYVAMFFGGISTGVGTVAPISVIINNWFVAKRATCMSIAIAGSMFGSAVLMVISGHLVDAFDWRLAFRMLGIAIGVVSALTSLFIIVETPAQKGQVALRAGGESSQAGAQSAEVGGVTPAQAKSSASYWLLLLGILLIGCSTNVENFLPAFWKSNGLSVSTASSIMGIYAVLAGVCAILLGRVTDKLGGRSYVLLTTVTFVAGTIGVFVAGVAAMPIMLMLLVPFAMGAKKTSNLTAPLVVSEIFGRKHYGAIIGSFTAMLQLGIAASNPIIGQLHAVSGGYKLPFMTMAALNVVALLLILVAMKLSPYRKAAK